MSFKTTNVSTEKQNKRSENQGEKMEAGNFVDKSISR